MPKENTNVMMQKTTLGNPVDMITSCGDNPNNWCGKTTITTKPKPHIKSSTHTHKPKLTCHQSKQRNPNQPRQSLERWRSIFHRQTQSQALSKPQPQNPPSTVKNSTKPTSTIAQTIFLAWSSSLPQREMWEWKN